MEVSAVCVDCSARRARFSHSSGPCFGGATACGNLRGVQEGVWCAEGIKQHQQRRGEGGTTFEGKEGRLWKKTATWRAHNTNNGRVS